MKPTRDDINFLIRNHFEKCLMEAEDSRWALHAAVKEGQEDESDVLSNIARLQEDYSRLKQSAKLQGFNREHEEIAAELLNWRELEFSRLGELFRDLAQGVMDAQLEAKRLQIAHMERDEQGMNILPDFLKPCKNYLQYPDFDAFWEYRDTPYHGMAKENKGITLEEAANLYFEEKQKETKSWHQSHRVFIGRLQEFLGADTY